MTFDEVIAALKTQNAVGKIQEIKAEIAKAKDTSNSPVIRKANELAARSWFARTVTELVELGVAYDGSASGTASNGGYRFDLAREVATILRPPVAMDPWASINAAIRAGGRLSVKLDEEADGGICARIGEDVGLGRDAKEALGVLAAKLELKYMSQEPASV